MATQAYFTQVHNLSAQHKTGENLALLMKEELEHLRQIGTHPISVVGDASGDERKARQMILKDDPSLLIIAGRTRYVLRTREVSTKLRSVTQYPLHG